MIPHHRIGKLLTIAAGLVTLTLVLDSPLADVIDLFVSTVNAMALGLTVTYTPSFVGAAVREDGLEDESAFNRWLARRSLITIPGVDNRFRSSEMSDPEDAVPALAACTMAIAVGYVGIWVLMGAGAISIVGGRYLGMSIAARPVLVDLGGIGVAVAIGAYFWFLERFEAAWRHRKQSESTSRIDGQLWARNVSIDADAKPSDDIDVTDSQPPQQYDERLLDPSDDDAPWDSTTKLDLPAAASVVLTALNSVGFYLVSAGWFGLCLWLGLQVNIDMYVGAVIALGGLLGGVGFVHFDEKLRNSRWYRGW
jgi:hypothetical protein